MKTGRCVLRSVLGVALSLSAAMAFASEKPVRYYIKNWATGQYLTAQGHAMSVAWNHQPVTIAPFSPGNRRQMWTFDAVPGQPTKFFLYNAIAGRVLDVNAGNKLVGTHPRTSGGMPANQVWWLRSGRIEGALGCLDAYWNGGGFGPTVGTWNCHEAHNQQWDRIKVIE